MGNSRSPQACNAAVMRTAIAISPSLFALLLLASSGIATAVSTTVASSVREAPLPPAHPPEAPTVDPLRPVLEAAIEAELQLGTAETLDPAGAAKTARLYRFYVDEHVRLQASGPLEWARSRAASFEQLRADLDELHVLEEQARALEEQRLGSPRPEPRDG